MGRSKHKTLSALFVSAAMMLGLLGGCWFAPNPAPSASAEMALTAKELIERIRPYSGYEGSEVEEYLNAVEDREQLEAYIEKAYALTGWVDGAIARAKGASAFELAAIRMADEGAARDGEDSLKGYLHSREGDFTGYAPEQADMVSSGVVIRNGTWLGLFICPDPEGVRATFEAVLKGEAMPQQPTPTPELELGEDLLPLMVDLIRFCKEEIDAMGGYTYGISTGLSADYIRRVAEEDYNMDAAQMESGFRVMGGRAGSADYAFELAVLRMTGEGEAARSMDGLWRYLQDRGSLFTEMELPGEAAMVAGGVVFQSGQYLALLICQSPETVRAELEDALFCLQSTVPSKSPQKVDMELLMERLSTVCQDEIDEILNQNEIVIRTTDISIFRNTFKPATDFCFDQAESGLYFDGYAEEDTLQVGVLYMKDERAAANLAAALQIHLWREEYQYLQDGLFEQAKQMSNGLTLNLGRYVALFVCQNPQAMKAELETALRDLEADGTPSIPPGTPEQPIFVELENPMPEGELDPDSPGRIKYAQPNKEDMSGYDTSAILAAWEKGDPSGLSEEERAIYDAAQDVLKEVLHDGMNAFVTEAALYDWVVQNIDYGWSRMDVLEQAPREAYTPYGGLVDRKAVCLGYASSFQLLMEMAELECITVVGASHASTVDHAWNMVRLNGEWYCTDATWDYAYRETMKGCEWRYFNVTSDYMVRTNHQWDYMNTPEAAAEDHGKT